MTKRFKHIRLSGRRQSVPYTYAGPSGSSKHERPPRPAPNVHGPKILDSLNKAKEKAEQELAKTPTGAGLTFISQTIEV